ncbi:MAG: DMT family transporter [Rhizobiaceae bacterium]
MTRSPAGLADYGLLASLGVMWGGSFMLINLAVVDFPPATLTVIRLLVAAVIIFAVAASYSEKIKFRARTVWLIILAGFFGNALPFSMISWGQVKVDASLAAILMGIMPITTFFLAHFLTRDERLTARKLVGGFIGLTGLVILVGPAVLLRLGDDGVRQLAILAAAVSYSINAILTKQLLDLPRRAAVAWVLLAGALVMVPVAVLADNPQDLSVGLVSGIALLTLGVFPTAVATLVMFSVLHRQGASFFGQVNFIVPVFGIIWAAIILGEQPALSAYVALGFILAGIWVARGSGQIAPMQPAAGSALPREKGSR